jgi:hypothetical protein
VSGAVGVVLLGGAAEAFIGDGAVTNAGRATDVSATRGGPPDGGGVWRGRGTVSLAGAAAAETVRTRTQAYIGEGALVNQDPTLANYQQTVSVNADSSTQVVSVSGSIGAGAVGGVGASVTVGIIEKLTQAWIGRSAAVDAGSGIDVTATSREDVTAVTASLQGGGAAGAAGMVSVHDVGNATAAFIDEGAQVSATGNIKVAAEDEAELDIVTGGAALGGAVGVAGSVNVNTLTSETRAWIASGTQVAALGAGAAMAVPTGEIAVTALGTQDVFAETFGLAGSATVGAAGAVTVDIIKTTTVASIADGATVAAGAAGAVGLPDVRVAAGDHSTVWGGAQTLAGSGAASVSGSADTTIIEKQTSASIGAANVQAAGDIDVQAASSEAVESLTADISGSMVAGFGGVVSVARIDNDTAAYVASGADINSTGNLSIDATDDPAIKVLAGNAAIGGAAGVGGSVIVTEIGSDTEAWIGAAETDAAGATRVVANSSEDVDTLVVSGAGGGGAGVAAAVSINTVETLTRASIDSLAQVNQAAAGQRVEVKASDQVRVDGKAGGLGLGGSLGVGAATDVATVRNTVSASIGTGPTSRDGRHRSGGRVEQGHQLLRDRRCRRTVREDRRRRIDRRDRLDDLERWAAKPAQPGRR